MRLFLSILLGLVVVSLMFYGIWVPWPDPMEAELRAILRGDPLVPTGPVADSVDQAVATLEAAAPEAWACRGYADEFRRLLEAAQSLARHAHNERDMESRAQILRQVSVLLGLAHGRVDEDGVPNDDWVVQPGPKHDLAVALSRVKAEVDRQLPPVK